MPFEIVQGDITEYATHAIWNAASPMPVVGGGADAGRYAETGPRLLQTRQRRVPVAERSASLTGGYSLPPQFVFYAVCPVGRGGNPGDEALLCHAHLFSDRAPFQVSADLMQRAACFAEDPSVEVSRR